MENETLRLQMKSGGTPSGNDNNQKLLTFYDFDRFDVNYTSNVARYLLKDKK